MYLIKFLKFSTQKQTTKLLAQGLYWGSAERTGTILTTLKLYKLATAVQWPETSVHMVSINVKLPGLCGKNLSWQSHLPRCQTLNPAVLLPEPNQAQLWHSCLESLTSPAVLDPSPSAPPTCSYLVHRCW